MSDISSIDLLDPELGVVENILNIIFPQTDTEKVKIFTFISKSDGSYSAMLNWVCFHENISVEHVDKRARTLYYQDTTPTNHAMDIRDIPNIQSMIGENIQLGNILSQINQKMLTYQIKIFEFTFTTNGIAEYVHVILNSQL